MPIYRKVNKKFFRKWGSEMAYVLGFFAADGNMVATKRGTHFIAFYSADKQLLRDMKDAMESDHLLGEQKSEVGRVYRFQIGSREMFEDLVRLGFEPKKTLRMRVPNVPKKYRGDFVRGYFDGDGNVWSGVVNKHRANPSKVIQAAFTSGCKQFLEDLRKVLKEEGLMGGTLYTHPKRNFSRLSYNTRDALKLARLMYNADTSLFLQRKKARFEQFQKLRT